MDFLPGYLQGITRVIISYPFDYVRINLQMNKYKNIRDFLMDTKLKTIYRGVSLPLITVPIDRAIQFKIYEYYNKKNVNTFFSGGISGIISSLVNLPSSYICNTYILDKNNNNLSYYIKNFLKKENYTKLYYGYKPEFMRCVLASSIYLGIYGNLRNKYGNDMKQSIINSAVAGISVWTVTYPLETIKLEQQINNNNNIISIYKNRINKYGFFNLWKGIIPIYMRTLPSSIGGMIVYESCRNYLV